MGGSKKEILAVVTTNRNKVSEGTPVFYAENAEELERTSRLLARVLTAAIHDLDNECVVIVRH
ncbi:MAG TPA: hypothetical protein GX008_02630 [Firmicutes bacterium]|jgi:hypothetical protein|nr:MAG: hypothetical protein AA931_02640 [Peptococcaceae bacterium 1109]HHT72589.1 hypothetical protein [Bacillota bacterium]